MAREIEDPHDGGRVDVRSSPPPTRPQLWGLVS
jgi:hypothetical protein